MYIIETPRLFLRRFQASDVDHLHAVFGDLRVMRHLGAEAGSLLSSEETLATIRKYESFWEKNGFGMFAVVHKEQQQLIGCSGFRFFRGSGDSEPEPEYLVLLKPDYWRQGLATELFIATLHYGFETAKLPYVVAVTRTENIATRFGLEKGGLTGEPITFRNIKCIHYKITREKFSVYREIVMT
jgi:RimJ/RimL family protein N-acetyltransferase